MKDFWKDFKKRGFDLILVVKDVKEEILKGC